MPFISFYGFFNALVNKQVKGLRYHGKDISNSVASRFLMKVRAIKRLQDPELFVPFTSSIVDLPQTTHRRVLRWSVCHSTCNCTGIHILGTVTVRANIISPLMDTLLLRRFVIASFYVPAGTFVWLTPWCRNQRRWCSMQSGWCSGDLESQCQPSAPSLDYITFRSEWTPGCLGNRRCDQPAVYVLYMFVGHRYFRSFLWVMPIDGWRGRSLVPTWSLHLWDGTQWSYSIQLRRACIAAFGEKCHDAQKLAFLLLVTLLSIDVSYSSSNLVLHLMALRSLRIWCCDSWQSSNVYQVMTLFSYCLEQWWNRTPCKELFHTSRAIILKHLLAHDEQFRLLPLA